MSTTVFTDTKQRQWDLALNVATVRRVKNQTSVDLLALDDAATLQKLVYDPMGLAMALWAVVEPQAREREVDEEDFGSALGGDTLNEATDALLNAITGFFRPAQRHAMIAALGRMREAEKQQAEQMAERIATMPIPQVDLPDEVPTPGGSSTSSPA